METRGADPVGSDGQVVWPIRKGIYASFPPDPYVLARRRYRAFAAEQTQGEGAAGDDELVEGLGDVAVFDHEIAALFRGDEGRSTQQLLDKGGAHAFGAGDDGVRVFEAQVEAVTVEGDQTPAAIGVGERDLGGLIYAAGARGERGLE